MQGIVFKIMPRMETRFRFNSAYIGRDCISIFHCLYVAWGALSNGAFCYKASTSNKLSTGTQFSGGILLYAQAFGIRSCWWLGQEGGNPFESSFIRYMTWMGITTLGTFCTEQTRHRIPTPNLDLFKRWKWISVRKFGSATGSSKYN